MADQEKLVLQKLVKLVQLQRDLQNKLLLVTDEIDALLGGKASIGDQLKAFEAAFDDVWCARYAGQARGRYVWSFTKDRAHTKRLIKSIGLEELIERAARYLRSNDQFFVTSRHSFGAFVHSINQHAKESAPADADELTLEAPTVLDCKHTPRCQSDQTHTARRAREMREGTAF